MKIPLSELILLLCEEVQKSRKYLDLNSKENSLQLNIDEVELSLPIGFNIEEKSAKIEDLEKVQEQFLELEIPFNYQNSILKESILESKKFKELNGEQVYCQIINHEHSDRHDEYTGRIRLKLKLFFS